jgi:NADH:ubiquinone oxidoreductase subunit F (NADH-binding)
MIDVRLDFKALAEAGSMLGSGAIVVCDDTTCMLDMALNAVRFYRNESCGKCVPCRVGCTKMTDMLVRWTQGAVPNSNIAPTSRFSTRALASQEPHFDLRPRPDCARADSVGPETFRAPRLTGTF